MEAAQICMVRCWSPSFARVMLPKSKFQLRLPLYEYWNAVSGDEGRRGGAPPHHVVRTTMANLLLGVDEQFDLALILAL